MSTDYKSYAEALSDDLEVAESQVSTLKSIIATLRRRLTGYQKRIARAKAVAEKTRLDGDASPSRVMLREYGKGMRAAIRMISPTRKPRKE